MSDFLPAPFASSEVEKPRAGISTALDTNGICKFGLFL